MTCSPHPPFASINSEDMPYCKVLWSTVAPSLTSSCDCVVRRTLMTIVNKASDSHSGEQARVFVQIGLALSCARACWVCSSLSLPSIFGPSVELILSFQVRKKWHNLYSRVWLSLWDNGWKASIFYIYPLLIQPASGKIVTFLASKSSPRTGIPVVRQAPHAQFFSITSCLRLLPP